MADGQLFSIGPVSAETDCNGTGLHHDADGPASGGHRPSATGGDNAASAGGTMADSQAPQDRPCVRPGIRAGDSISLLSVTTACGQFGRHTRLLRQGQYSWWTRAMPTPIRLRPLDVKRGHIAKR